MSSMNDPTQQKCPKVLAVGDNTTHHFTTSSTGVQRCVYCRETREALAKQMEAESPRR